VLITDCKQYSHIDMVAMSFRTVEAHKQPYALYIQRSIYRGFNVSGWPNKLDHIGICVADLEAAKAFYTAALAPIGFEILSESDTHASFGISPMPYLTVSCSNVSPSPVHIAFTAESRSQVDAFHASAILAGGTDNGRAGLRPDYHRDYYGAFVLDPDGHNIEVVKHAAE